MQKIILPSLIAAAMLISSCSGRTGLESRKNRLVNKRSYLVAEAYIDSCKTNDRTLLAVNLSQFQTDLPDNAELQDMRNKVDSSIVDIRNYLMSVERYRKLIESGNNSGMRNREFNRAQRFIMDSLTRNSEEYTAMREKSLSLIKENNLKILTMIIADYRKRGEEIPLNWIPGNMRAGILQNPEILELDKKIENIEKIILEKYGNMQEPFAYNQLPVITQGSCCFVLPV